MYFNFQQYRLVKTVHTNIIVKQEYDPVTVLVWINQTLQLRKSCSVHRTVFEIVEFRQVTGVNIVTGQVEKDNTHGKSTCHKCNSKSAIDYVLVSRSIFTRVIEF